MVVAGLLVSGPGVIGAGDAAPSPGTPALPLPSFAPLPPSAVRVFTAGDIGECGSPTTSATAAIVAADPSAIVLALGDEAYPEGAPEDYRDCFDPAWGAFKDRTWAIPGNHDEDTPGAAGFHAYFGDRGGSSEGSWRALDVGAWRVYLLDSECEPAGRCRGSDQLDWLRADLAAHPSACILAAVHRPRYSSGPHRDEPSVQPLWAALADAGADVMLSGHDHVYERLAPLDAAGRPTDHGIRAFVVGTGGAELYAFETPLEVSEARADATHGVLELVLRPDGYDWTFRAAMGTPFEDAGSGTC